MDKRLTLKAIAGAGGAMPAYTLRSSAPDGYTLGVIAASVPRLLYTTKAGLRLNHVPYRGSAESIRAVLSNEVQSAAETSGWAPQVGAGRFRLPAVWSDKRMAHFPNVPTLKESGIDIIQAPPWGIAAPRGTSPTITRKLHDTFEQAMEAPDFKKALAQFDMEPIYKDPVQYRQSAADAMKREKDMQESLNIVRQ